MLKLFILVILAAAVISDPNNPPSGYPVSYLAQMSQVDREMHTDFEMRTVVAVDEKIGVFAHLPGQLKLTCMNNTVGNYICFVVSYGADPVECQVFEQPARDVYELGLVSKPGDDLIYMREEVIGGQICEVWYDSPSQMIWTFTRDTPHVPVRVQARDMSADVNIDSLESADVSGLILPPPFACESAELTVRQVLRVQRQKNVLEAHPEHAPVVSEELVRQINANQNMYTATVYPEFAGMTIQEFASKLGAYPSAVNMDVYRPTRGEHARKEDLPDEFDARAKWPLYLHQSVWDQAHCGSCWAHATSMSFGDRVGIATNGNNTDGASRQYLISCNTNDNGCHGGDSYHASVYIRDNGIPSEKCVPTYSSAQGQVPVCPTKCEDGTPYTLMHSVDAFHVLDEEDIKYELYHFGPLRSDFTVYLDFVSYKSGVYRHNETSPRMGGHAVTLIGYGVEAGVKYWLCQNSWGPNWGINGTFKIVRGEHECGIDDAITGLHAPVSSQDNGCNYDICQSGQCVSYMDGEMECICPPSFGGKYCGTWLDPCLVNGDVCNGFTCNSTYGEASYTCECEAPYGGDHCKAFDCGAYVARNGYNVVSCTGHATTDQCHLECGRGYVGEAVDVSCYLGGWSNATGCNIITCGETTTTDGYSTKTCTGHSFGDSCSVSCASGYNGDGGDIVCLGNAKWSKPYGCEVKKTGFQWFGIVLGGSLAAVGVAFIGFFYGGKRQRLRNQYEPILDKTRRTSINQ